MSPISNPTALSLRRACALLAAAVAAALASALVLGPGQPAAQAAGAARPNVVMLMTDDQDAAALSVMAAVRRQIAAAGASFRQSFVSDSNCCPSRATFLTGQYDHNHGVRTDEPPNGGYKKLDNSNTLAVWLQRAGYYTAHIGKYLNGYGNPPLSQPTEVPPGWTDWHGAVDPSTYQMYGFTLNESGKPTTYGDPESRTGAAGDYQTDVYARKALDIVRARAGAPAPFFLSVAFLAPHVERARPERPNPRPAPRHEGRFGSAPLPRPPSFNEADVSDKPAEIRKKRGPFTQARIDRITADHRDRLRSLLAVDEAVDRIVQALRETGQLERTLIVFTSDNGWMQGQHRIPDGKRVFYEESVRVPLLMRGPGIRPGTVITTPVGNVDLAPTIAAVTGARPGRVMDGRSLTPLLRAPDLGWARPLLFETRSERGVRTDRYKYIENTSGENELYDLRRDRYELKNVIGERGHSKAALDLRGLARRLSTCRGTACRLTPRIAVSMKRRGTSCSRGTLQVRASGTDARRVVKLTLTAGRSRLGRDGAAPFSLRVSARRAARASALRISVELRDGRVLALNRVAPRCSR